jgi:uncharacterized coiled-coil protein SlyX
MSELKDELRALIRELKAGEVQPGVASVLTQLFNVLLRALDQERRVKDQDELEARIAGLEGRTSHDQAA